MTDSPTGTDLSRRSLVKTAATAAAVGGALAVAGPAAGAEAATTAVRPGADRAPASEHHDAGDGVMARVLDARLGTLEIYTPTGHRTITDRPLADAIARLGR